MEDANPPPHSHMVLWLRPGEPSPRSVPAPPAAWAATLTTAEALAVDPGQPAASYGQPAASAVQPQTEGPPPTRQMSTMEELEALRDTEAWQRLWHTIEETCKGGTRQVLSHHTTAACQKGKRMATARFSLKDAGIQTFLPASGGKSKVRVVMPNAVYCGDQWPVDYTSPEFETGRRCKQHASTELLCFLLSMAPDKVRMPEKMFRLGLQDDLLIRKAAWEVNEAYEELLLGRPVESFPIPVSLLHHCREPVELGTPWLAKGESQPAAAHEHHAIQLLKGLTPGKTYDAAALPSPIKEGMRALMRDSQVLAFLQRHPTLFKVETRVTKGVCQLFITTTPKILLEEGYLAFVETTEPASGSEPSGGGDHVAAWDVETLACFLESNSLVPQAIPIRVHRITGRHLLWASKHPEEMASWGWRWADWKKAKTRLESQYSLDIFGDSGDMNCPRAASGNAAEQTPSGFSLRPSHL